MAAALIVSACSTPSQSPAEAPTAAPSPAPAGRTLTGTVVLEQAIPVAIGDTCDGIEEHADVAEGAQVVVVNELGDRVAVGRLSEGLAIDTGQGPNFLPWCQFEFTVPDVPEADIYTVEIANRDGLTFRHDELDQLDWQIEATVG